MIEKIMDGIKNMRGEERDGIAFIFMNRPEAWK